MELIDTYTNSGTGQEQIKKRDVEKNIDGLRERVLAIRGKQDQVALDKAETAIAYAVCLFAFSKPAPTDFRAGCSGEFPKDSP